MRTIRIRSAPIGPHLNVPPRQAKGFGRFFMTRAGVCFHIQIQIIQSRNSTPDALARDITGQDTEHLLSAEITRPSPARPVLNDTLWVGLQGICGG